MKELGIDLTMEEIAETSKLRFKELIKNKVETKALQYLTKLRLIHLMKVVLSFFGSSFS